MRIAALDDDPDQLDLTRRTMVSIGHDCHVFEDGRSLLRTLRRESFDLLVLDWQLPDVPGPEVVRWVRNHVPVPLPILFLTNRSQESDLVEGLAAGADDFMVKPTRVGELTARVHALLRRAYPTTHLPELVWDRYRFDIPARTLYIDGESVELKQKEYDLALLLFQNMGRLLSRKHLLEAVWGIEADIASRSLDTHASRLRIKLGLRPQHGLRLAAVYSLGYRLDVVGAAGDDPA